MLHVENNIAFDLLENLFVVTSIVPIDTIAGFFGEIRKDFQNNLKDTNRENAPSNKTPALAKSVNKDIWIVGTSNQLFIRGSETETKFPKKLSNY